MGFLSPPGDFISLWLSRRLDWADLGFVMLALAQGLSPLESPRPCRLRLPWLPPTLNWGIFEGMAPSCGGTTHKPPLLLPLGRKLKIVLFCHSSSLNTTAQEAEKEKKTAELSYYSGGLKAIVSSSTCIWERCKLAHDILIKARWTSSLY